MTFRPGAYVSLFTLSELQFALEDHLEIKVDIAMKDSLKPKIGKRILAEVEYL